MLDLIIDTLGFGFVLVSIFIFTILTLMFCVLIS
jgi:hypothetical protein